MSALEGVSDGRLVWRRVRMPLLLATVVLAYLVGAAPAAAGAQTEYCGWAPRRDIELAPPLNDQRVLEAIDLAVDENAISISVFGETGRVVFVWGGTEDRPASTAFDPEQARLLLEAAGWPTLTLSLAVSPPDDPPTVQVAEAIAVDLRNNLGAQVAVDPHPDGTEGWDLLVEGMPIPRTPTAGPPEPTPELAAPTPLGPLDLSLDVTCTPDTFRPYEYVAVECVTRLANQGQNTLSVTSLNIGGYSGPVPTYFFMWSKRDGEFAPISTGALSLGGGDLEPGRTVVSSTVVLLRIGEGTFETELTASVGGQVIASVPIRFVATPGAAEPPTDLLVTVELVSDTGPEAEFAATYETTITNQGSSEVTQLTLTARHDERATFTSAEPAPASENPGAQLASWDLASFGRQSLAPGESLVLSITYGPSQQGDCWGMATSAVVEATVGGQEQRYGARPTTDVLIGECGGGDFPASGGGGGLPMGLGQGGEGPAPSGGHQRWPEVALAIAGAVLIAAGLAARRQARL